MDTRTMFCDHKLFMSRQEALERGCCCSSRDRLECSKLGQASVSGAFGFSMFLVTELVQCLMQPFPCLRLMTYFAMIGLHGNEIHF